jgi:hypothetical protein
MLFSTREKALSYLSLRARKEYDKAIEQDKLIESTTKIYGPSGQSTYLPSDGYFEAGQLEKIEKFIKDPRGKLDVCCGWAEFELKELPVE